jgi:hypothetical protein
MTTKVLLLRNLNETNPNIPLIPLILCFCHTIISFEEIEKIIFYIDKMKEHILNNTNNDNIYIKFDNKLYIFNRFDKDFITFIEEKQPTLEKPYIFKIEEINNETTNYFIQVRTHLSFINNDKETHINGFNETFNYFEFLIISK